MTFERFDAEAGLFLSRQLEFIRPQIFETKYADIKYPTILPVTSEAGPGAQTYTYRVMNATGEFKLIADAADDLPRADVAVLSAIRFRNCVLLKWLTLPLSNVAPLPCVVLMRRKWNPSQCSVILLPA